MNICSCPDGLGIFEWDYDPACPVHGQSTQEFGKVPDGWSTETQKKQIAEAFGVPPAVIGLEPRERPRTGHRRPVARRPMLGRDWVSALLVGVLVAVAVGWVLLAGWLAQRHPSRGETVTPTTIVTETVTEPGLEVTHTRTGWRTRVETQPGPTTTQTNMVTVTPKPRPGPTVTVTKTEEVFPSDFPPGD